MQLGCKYKKNFWELQEYRRFLITEINNNLLAHQFNIPFFIWMVAKVLFAISTQIPLANDFPLSERKFVPLCGTDKGMLTSTKLAVANLFTTLLWLAATPSAYWSPLSTFSHNVRNVMRGRRLSLRHSVKHYEASDPKSFMLRFICICSRVLFLLRSSDDGNSIALNNQSDVFICRSHKTIISRGTDRK